MSVSIRIVYSGSKTCVVHPEQAGATTGAVAPVTWEAIDADATIYFPNHDLFKQSELFVPKGQTRTLTPQISGVKQTYSVWCHKEGGFFGKGDAGNEPVLIIPG